MRFSKKQVIILFGVVLLVAAVVLVFTGVIPGLKPETVNVYRADLDMWIFGTEPTPYSGAFSRFKVGYPGVNLNYRVLADEETYEDALIDALAAGNGPDIFSIPNESIYSYKNKISPVPSTQLPLVQLRQYFPQTVERELIDEKGVYGLPVSMDSLALIYNRDLLDQEGFVAPPTTWDEFQEYAVKLTKRNSEGEIIRAGAAIGGSERSVPNAADILSTLMLQSGVSMTDYRVQNASFASKEGFDVMKYYTHFAMRGTKGQVWDESMPNAFDHSASEKVAMIFAYKSDLVKILKKNPYIDYAVALMPQPKNATKVITYPKYRVFTVSRQSKASTAAWSFIITLTLYPEAVLPYLTASKEPPALRPILARFANDPVLSIYARQVLTNQSWPQLDPQGATQALSQAIREVVSEGVSVTEALSRAQTTITSQMKRRL